MWYGLLRVPLAEKFRTEALSGNGVIGRKAHSFFKSRERPGVVQQNLSRASEIGPRLREVRLQRYGPPQFRGGPFDLTALAIYFRAKIVRISRVRALSQELDGTIKVGGRLRELAGLDERSAEVHLRGRVARVKLRSLFERFARGVQITKLAEGLAERILRPRGIRKQSNSLGELGNRFGTFSLLHEHASQQQMRVGIAGIGLDQVVQEMNGFRALALSQQVPGMFQPRLLRKQQRSAKQRGAKQ